MVLYDEILLPYPGWIGADGLCHVRMYTQAGWWAWRRPVVIVGELECVYGTSVDTAGELIAGLIRGRLPRRFRRFRTIEYLAGQSEDSSDPCFTLIGLRGVKTLRPERAWRHLGWLCSYATPEGWKLFAPQPSYPQARARRTSIEHEQLEQLLGCNVATWPAHSYTASQLAGAAGERLQEIVDARKQGVLGRYGVPV